jgi:hypothetical protein
MPEAERMNTEIRNPKATGSDLGFRAWDFTTWPDETHSPFGQCDDQTN